MRTGGSTRRSGRARTSSSPRCGRASRARLRPDCKWGGVRARCDTDGGASSAFRSLRGDRHRARDHPRPPLAEGIRARPRPLARARRAGRERCSRRCDRRARCPPPGRRRSPARCGRSGGTHEARSSAVGGESTGGEPRRPGAAQGSSRPPGAQGSDAAQPHGLLAGRRHACEQRACLTAGGPPAGDADHPRERPGRKAAAHAEAVAEAEAQAGTEAGSQADAGRPDRRARCAFSDGAAADADTDSCDAASDTDHRNLAGEPAVDADPGQQQLDPAPTASTPAPAATQPCPSPPSSGKPGWGNGDKNHEHTGPPGHADDSHGHSHH